MVREKKKKERKKSQSLSPFFLHPESERDVYCQINLCRHVRNSVYYVVIDKVSRCTWLKIQDAVG